MKFEARSTAVFRDFEKLYKLVALYKGNKEQLAPHIRNIDASLQETLDDPDFPEGLIQFDFLMQAVFSEGFEVFRASNPELTMSYALFCEGVRSVVAVKGLKGQEILDWCLFLREALKPREGDPVDLASLLWRNRFQHLKIHVFNALLSVEEIGWSSGVADLTDEFNPFATDDELAIDKRIENEQLARSKKFSLEGGAGGVETTTGTRKDDWWALPTAQKFLHLSSKLEAYEIERLRSQLADASYSDKAKNLVRFRPDEVQALGKELESYDANHIDFNLLNHYLNLFETGGDLSSEARALALKRLETLSKEILNRFHAGLILFLMGRLNELKNRPELKAFIAEISKWIQAALDKPENRQMLLDSLETEEGRKIAYELLPHIERKEWTSLLDTLISRRRKLALNFFLQFLMKQSEDIEKTFFGLPPERLKALLPLIRDVRWDGKSRFLQRCLTHKSPIVAEATFPFLVDVDLSPEQLLSIYRRLPDSLKARWSESILLERRFERWVPFCRALLKSNEWRQLGETAAVWALRLIVQTLGEEALDQLENWISARSFWLFPSFPKERDICLSALMISRIPELKQRVDYIVDREAGLIFQSGRLKERLKGRG